MMHCRSEEASIRANQLTHRNLRLKVLDVCRPLCVVCRRQLLKTSFPKLLAGFGGNDPHMALFNNCSNNSSLLNIKVDVSIYRFLK